MTGQISDSGGPSGGGGRKRIAVPPWILGAVGVVLVAILAGVLLLLFRDDSETIDAVDITTSSTAESTTSQAESTTTEATSSTSEETTTSDSSTTTDSTTTIAPSSTSTIPSEYSTAVWPWFNSETRYDDPVEAATGFAEHFLGFTDPVMGEFLQGDSRSGEVEVQPMADGPVTTVFIRLLGTDDTWWILGSATQNISVDEPTALCEIDSPLAVSGQAFTFEGNVEVQVRADGIEAPLATTAVTGGGSEMLPFDGLVSFADPGSGSGAVVFLSRSARDGSVWEAVVLRVSFGPGGC